MSSQLLCPGRYGDTVTHEIESARHVLSVEGPTLLTRPVTEICGEPWTSLLLYSGEDDEGAKEKFKIDTGYRARERYNVTVSNFWNTSCIRHFLSHAIFHDIVKAPSAPQLSLRLLTCAYFGLQANTRARRQKRSGLTRDLYECLRGFSIPQS